LSVLCLAGALLNIAINTLATRAAGLPLYLDTILTLSLTLAGGLFWGLLTGLLTNIIATPLYSLSYGWVYCLFALCNMATALVAWLFTRFFPRELQVTAETPEIPRKSQGLASRRLSELMNRMIVLILLSFCLCLVISVLDGVIAAFIQSINPELSGKPSVSGDLAATMFGHKIPAILEEILSRIPVNVIDRLITAFAGYGIAAGIKRLMSSVQ